MESLAVLVFAFLSFCCVVMGAYFLGRHDGLKEAANLIEQSEENS